MTHTLDYAARNPLPLDVISIQSQVVYGTVGNNAALPTLAAHGLPLPCQPSFSPTPRTTTRSTAAPFPPTGLRVISPTSTAACNKKGAALTSSSKSTPRTNRKNTG